MKTGLQGHVHTLLSLRGGPNGWAGEPDVHGMGDKEVVRAPLECQDINGLHLLLDQAPASQQNQPQGLTSADHKWVLHRQRLDNTVPMNALHALVMRCCFHCDHPMHCEGGHSINNCKFTPCVKEQAGLDHSIWDTRWGGAGPSGKDAFLATQAARQQGTAPGAIYVTTTSSQPYTRPGVPHPVHVLSSFGQGLHAISVPDTLRESLTTIADLASLMLTQTESMSAMQPQMDDILLTIHPQQLLTMSVPKPSVSAAKVAQIFDNTPVGYVRGGVALDNETKLFFSPSDWERLITPLEQLGQSPGGTGAADGVDTRPMVLLACAPNDYIHGGTYVDGRTPFGFF